MLIATATTTAATANTADAGNILQLDEYEQRVRRLYDGKRQDINLALGRDSGLVHHHFGIGRLNGLDIARLSQADIDRTMHTLENAQVDLILGAMSDLAPSHRVFDGGSGRGGTALLLNRARGCRYDGANISDYQLEFSRELARREGIADRVCFHKANMRQTPFADACFDWTLTNETTMYVVDLIELFREFARILKPGGRYVCMTWAINALHPGPRPYIDPIDEHYLCKMHTDRDYIEAMLANNLVPVHVEDHSADAVDYWRLRSFSERRTGVEPLYRAGYAAKAVKYLRIVAQRSLATPGYGH
jgi:geranyl diphosphate 2-C-methyltransferase